METTTLGLSLDSSTVVVIRTYNEKSNVTQIMQEILKILPLANILIVDDNSEDGTAAVVRELAANEGRLSLICRPRKMGIGTAYIAGFKWGLSRKFEYFVQMDADLSHDPQVLPVLLKNLGDADFVIGSRWIKGGKILG